jgi:hypothetical protein
MEQEAAGYHEAGHAAVMTLCLSGIINERGLNALNQRVV